MFAFSFSQYEPESGPMETTHTKTIYMDKENYKRKNILGDFGMNCPFKIERISCITKVKFYQKCMETTITSSVYQYIQLCRLK